MLAWARELVLALAPLAQELLPALAHELVPAWAPLAQELVLASVQELLVVVVVVVVAVGVAVVLVVVRGSRFGSSPEAGSRHQAILAQGNGD